MWSQVLVQANAFHLPFPDGYFHACCTSPPYWGLRKYAGDQGEEPLGLEADHRSHIERMVEVCREVWRVLRPDGVFWLNYGDCFAGSGGENANTGLGSGDRSGLYRNNPRKTRIQQGNLILMPHRVAIALQDDGWIVRNDLVWYKRNPMPESVAGWRWERSRTKTKDGNTIIGDLDREEGRASWTVFSGQGTRRSDLENPEYEYGDDYVLRKSSWRHTRAHEYVFQLVKQMGYYANQEVARVASTQHPTDWADGKPKRDSHVRGEFEGKTEDMQGRNAFRSIRPTRNPRSVLDVPTAPYKGAHYATFPPNLIAPLIRASVPRRCCAECGMAWAPVVEKEAYIPPVVDEGVRNVDESRGDKTRKLSGKEYNEQASSTVTDYRPTCEHDAEPVPGRVLDIFGGSGTTGMVAKQLMRNWVVMDISRPYLDAQARVRVGAGGMPRGSLEELPLFQLNDGKDDKE